MIGVSFMDKLTQTVLWDLVYFFIVNPWKRLDSAIDSVIIDANIFDYLVAVVTGCIIVTLNFKLDFSLIFVVPVAFLSGLVAFVFSARITKKINKSRKEYLEGRNGQ